jgi:hypothetical protein
VKLPGPGLGRVSDVELELLGWTYDMRWEFMGRGGGVGDRSRAHFQHHIGHYKMLYLLFFLATTPVRTPEGSHVDLVRLLLQTTARKVAAPLPFMRDCNGRIPLHCAVASRGSPTAIFRMCHELLFWSKVYKLPTTGYGRQKSE